MVYKPKKNQHLCVEIKERPSKCIIKLLLWLFYFFILYIMSLEVLKYILYHSSVMTGEPHGFTNS